MACLHKANILLPAKEIDRKKWAVIACDQFTSQPEYWKQVEDYVGGEPSTLRIIYPEVYLGNDDEAMYSQRLADIQLNMKRYLTEGILVEEVQEGYVLTVRETESGIQIGLLAALDLETYDYGKSSASAVRATEETVQERIPVRVGIRENALVESPHVMMLLDDALCRVLEPVYQKRGKLRRLYDTELMFGGGKVCGYAVEGDEAETLTAKLAELEGENREIFLAVGDGNHSLAAAKTCWEKLKDDLSEEQAGMHPARYALVEIVNLHSPALKFEAIHRVIYGGEMNELLAGFQKYLQSFGESRMQEWNDEKTADIVFLQGAGRAGIKLAGTKGRLPVELLQCFLDGYVREHSELEIDYVHSPETVKELAEDGKACGVLLCTMDKKSLFPAISAGGVLPRKTFSLGDECQKRYYMECRRL